MNLKSVFIFIISLLSFSLNAQLKESIHKTFDIEDSDKIVLDLAGDYEIVKWSGNTVMTQTEIELSDASPAIMRYYVSIGRYDVLGNISANTYVLSSKDKRRATIRFKELECYEHTVVKIFVPDSFHKVNETTLVYREDTDPFGEKSN